MNTPQIDPTQHEKDSAFERELSNVINRHSRENGSDTPDFILAAYLTDCMAAFNRATTWRGKWYSPEGVPVDERDSGPKPPYGNVKITAAPNCGHKGTIEVPKGERTPTSSICPACGCRTYTGKW